MSSTVKVLSHCLAYSPKLTPGRLRRQLIHAQKLGYAGSMFVPALVNTERYKPRDFVEVFKEVEMKAMACGFSPGNGPDPLNKGEYQRTLAALEQQSMFAIAFADAGIGPQAIAGPTHTHHRTQRPRWSQPAFERWMDALDAHAGKLGITFLCEPLNPTEDGTPNAFATVFKAIQQRRNLGIHFDIGHAHSRKLTADAVDDMASRIGLFEFANVGRWPLHIDLGLDVAAFAAKRRLLKKSWFSDEPFDQSVINLFELNALCPTTVPGPKCLMFDSIYLQGLGVMERMKLAA